MQSAKEHTWANTPATAQRPIEIKESFIFEGGDTYLRIVDYIVMKITTVQYTYLINTGSTGYPLAFYISMSGGDKWSLSCRTQFHGLITYTDTNMWLALRGYLGNMGGFLGYHSFSSTFRKLSTFRPFQ